MSSFRGRGRRSAVRALGRIFVIAVLAVLVLMIIALYAMAAAHSVMLP